MANINRNEGAPTEGRPYRILSALENHLNPVPGPKRHRRIQPHILIRRERQPVSLTNRRQEQHDFHYRKIVSDTKPGTTSEREVRTFRELTNKLFRPAFRTKRVRFREESRVSVGSPGEHENLRPGRNVISADLTVLNSLSADSVRRRVESHRLFRDRLSVFQLCQIRNRRQAAA